MLIIRFNMVHMGPQHTQCGRKPARLAPALQMGLNAHKRPPNLICAYAVARSCALAILPHTNELGRTEKSKDSRLCRIVLLKIQAELRNGYTSASIISQHPFQIWTGGIAMDLATYGALFMRHILGLAGPLHRKIQTSALQASFH